MYRAPDTKVDSFNCKLTEILQWLTKKKSVYICGDFNINVLNSERHIHSQSFIDVMYNFGFYALINKPTRITEFSATAIDNIFSNNLCDKTTSGILINIFVISQQKITRNMKERYILKRVINEGNLVALNQALTTVDWLGVYQSNNANSAYDYFVKKYTETFDLCCPLKKQKIRSKNLINPGLLMV